MGQVIVITSGKGGVGKTTCTANIGAGLALMGKKVCVVDGDMGLRNLDLLLGLENQIGYDIVDIKEEKASVKEALVTSPHIKNLSLLPTSQTKNKETMDEATMVRITYQLEEAFDYVLIDSPAGIEGGFRCALAGAHQCIIVVTPEVASIRDADRIAKILFSSGIKNPSIIVNRMRTSLVEKKEMLSIHDIQEILPFDIIGVIEEDEEIVMSTNRGVPIVSDRLSIVGESFRDIVKRILGTPIPYKKVKTPEKKSFWKRLFRG